MIIVQEIALILEKRDLEQLQQMLNMEEQTHRLGSPEENYRSPLNL